MATPTDALWELQVTGSDLNGGGFSRLNQGATGVDMTQSAPTSLTVTTNGTTALVATSGVFSNTMLGNFVNIAEPASGACYCITAYTDTTHVTLDRATVSSQAGLSARVGGPLASMGFVGFQHLAGNQIWLQYSATPFITTNISGNVSNGRFIGQPGGNATLQTLIRGYTLVRGDEVLNYRPTVQWGVNAGSTFLVTGNNFYQFHNFILDGNKANFTSTGGLIFNGQGQARKLKIMNCSYTGVGGGGTMKWYDVEISNCTHTATMGTNSVYCRGGYFHDNVGILFTFTTPSFLFVDCLFSNNGGIALRTTASCFGTVANCTFYGTTGAAINCTSTMSQLSVDNCHFENNSTYGIQLSVAASGISVINCSYYNNTTAKYTPNTISPYNIVGEVNLTQSAFVNAAAGDFRLNTSAGGGALLRGTGFPQQFPGLTWANGPNIGAVENSDVAYVAQPRAF